MNINANSEEYPFCQLNETINLAPDGRIISKSIMLNLRNQSPKEVYSAYKELKGLIEDKQIDSKREVLKKGNKESKRNQKTCPDCGAPLIEKNGISSKNGRPYHFLGCSAFPSCSFTKPFREEKEALPVADQDLLKIY